MSGRGTTTCRSNRLDGATLDQIRQAGVVAAMRMTPLLDRIHPSRPTAGQRLFPLVHGRTREPASAMPANRVDFRRIKICQGAFFLP